MAMIKCPECEREISDKASSCPGCGYPIKSEKEKDSQKLTAKKFCWGKRNKILITLFILVVIAITGVVYNFKVIQPKIKEKHDLEIYNEIKSLIKSEKYSDAIRKIKTEDLSQKNINKIVGLIKTELKDDLITSYKDISKEKIELYKKYLDMVNALGVLPTSNDYTLVEYLNQAIEIDNYSNYFDTITYYCSSEYEIRDGILNIALSGGQLYAPNLQSAIELLNGIDMSVYDNNSFGISEIINCNDIEKDCYTKLIQYANGDNRVNVESVLNDLTEEITQYTKVILEVISVIDDEINPIIESLPQIY